MPNATANVHAENQKTLVMVHDGYHEHLDNTLSSELKGDLKISNNGMFTTDNPELAAEMVEKYRGHVDVAPFNTDVKPNGRVMMTVPKMPYETEWDRKHARKVEE